MIKTEETVQVQTGFKEKRKKTRKEEKKKKKKKRKKKVRVFVSEKRCPCFVISSLFFPVVPKFGCFFFFFFVTGGWCIRKIVGFRPEGDQDSEVRLKLRQIPPVAVPILPKGLDILGEL